MTGLDVAAAAPPADRREALRGFVGFGTVEGLGLGFTKP